MNITTDSDWAGDWLNVGLLQQQVTHQLTQLLQLILRKIFTLRCDLHPLVNITIGHCFRHPLVSIVIDIFS